MQGLYIVFLHCCFYMSKRSEWYFQHCYDLTDQTFKQWIKKVVKLTCFNKNATNILNHQF